MELITPVDFFNSGKRLVRIRESQYASSHRQPVGKTGILSEHRTATCQVRCAALAEPSTPGRNVSMLSDGEFRLGALNEPSISVQLAGDFQGITKNPTLLQKVRERGTSTRQRQVE